MILAVAAITVESLPAQITVWTSLGPDGGSIGAIAIDPLNSNTAYAARGESGGGLFKTTDGGATWNPINSGLLTTMPVSALAIDSRNSNTLYAGIRYWPGGLFKSVDGGRNWLELSLPTGRLQGLKVVFSLAVIPGDPYTIYALTGGANGVFKSSDRGQTWNAVNFGFGMSEVLALAIDPQNPTTMYAATGDGVFKSEDAGANWRLLR